MASVTFDGISKVYDNGFKAVDNLDLSINDGEFMVLVGPSGCGKTTALRMLAGLEDISSGELVIDDRSSTTSRRRSATSRWSSRTTRCIRTSACTTTWPTG